MKKILLLLIFFLGITSAHAQETDTMVSKPFIEIQDSIFQYLNKEKIATGVLYDRIFPWADLTKRTTNDTIDSKYAEQVWYELELATYNKDSIMTTDEMKQRIAQNEKEDKGITLGYIDYNFNSIDTLAFERGDLTYDDDGLLHDGTGNPYL